MSTVTRTSKHWTLKRTQQCAKCPWRVETDPHEIPNGYSEERHRDLKCTIAKPGDVADIFAWHRHAMACHETHDAHCIGWLVNQIGPGNNIALRIEMMSCDNYKEIQLRGEQHERFEDTLP